MAATRTFLSFETVSLIVAFSVLAAAGLVTIRTEQHRRDSGALLRHTLEVEGALNRLEGFVRRAESEERGFLITRDPSYFAPKEGLSARLERDLTGIGALVADNPAQTERLQRISPVLRERIGLLLNKLELMRTGRFDEATQIVQGGRGKQLMDQIDAVISEMIASEEDLFRRREAKLGEATDTLQTAIGALVVIIASVAGFTIFVAEKQMNALRKSSDSLRAAYNQLIEESTRRAALEAQLRQSQKLEALGQLTGGIAHDFNNMLGVVVASLNILRRKLQKGEDGADKLIQSALDGTERAANLVHRLLAFSRVQPLHPTPLNANDLVAGMSTILQRTLGGNVQFSTSLEKDLWLTQIDANELENAILNLAVNARDAMRDGGQLTIETGNAALDQAYSDENPDARPGQYVMVAVTDTGCGMPPEVVEKAFDPFFTTKPVGKGTGLGLSQVHGFVRQSGGHVQIHSKSGRGTTIKLYLPRYVEGEEAAPAQVVSEPKPEEFPRGRPEEVVLVVEDDDTARRVTAQGVRELGYTVLEAESGKTAIQIIRERADIALMITDVVMPGMDGARLAREAVFRRHALHVLFITGYPSGSIASNGMLDPNVNLLAKPFSLAQLARKIRETLDARATLPEGKPPKR
ncbi:MAG: histidine kinase [Methylocystis sp.]|nr:MAG: histidine kinase [Methylocystis sp.]